MPPTSPTGFGPEADRIERGELASSTEARLRELVGWGGSTSFFTPPALAVATDVGVHPMGQVVGLAAGLVLRGYVRTTHPGQGRLRLGDARWREHTGPSKSWSALRHRALGRLTKQATLLGADAVIGIKAGRSVDRETEDGFGEAHVHFSGTAVRIEGWRHRGAVPVLTLASTQDLWSMFRSGLEPAGIAGAFAQVETIPSGTTITASVRWRRLIPNMELEDLTKAVYEVRRLALERLVADAKALNADGILGVDLDLQDAGSGHGPLPALTLTVHALASAVRRTKPLPLNLTPVLSISDQQHG